MDDLKEIYQSLQSTSKLAAALALTIASTEKVNLDDLLKAVSASTVAITGAREAIYLMEREIVEIAAANFPGNLESDEHTENY